MIFFLIMFVSVIGMSSFYIAYRLYNGIMAFYPRIKFWPILVIFLILGIIMMLGFGSSQIPISKELKHILSVVSAYYMGVYVYLLFFTIVSDIIMLIFRLTGFSLVKNNLLKGYASCFVIVFTFILCFYGFLNASRVDCVKYDVSIENKYNVSKLNLVMISDLHLGAVGSQERLVKIIDKINTLNPDLVCVAGDFFDTDYESIQEPEKAVELLKQIKSKYGVYACLGNHDAGDTFSQMISFLDKADITLLNDDYRIIDSKFVLVGRLDGSPIGGYDGFERKEFDEIYDGKYSDLPVVVLEHNPKNVGKYGKEADLILCGHTHKGQLFPANFITNAMFDVDYGYYRRDKDSPHVIVSSGVGTWGMPMRVGTNCEIVNIHLS